MKKMESDESRLNNWISLGFNTGTAASLALVVIGLIILFIISGIKDIKPLVTLEQIPAAIVISIGVLLLLLTPIIQVIVALAFFSITRNRLFVGISLAVFCFAVIGLALALI